MSLIALFCATQFCDPCRFPGKEVALTLLAAKQIHFPEGAMTLQQEIIQALGAKPRSMLRVKFAAAWTFEVVLADLPFY
jgi:hypothetical protein